MKDEEPSVARRQYEEADASQKVRIKEAWIDEVSRNFTLLGFYDWLERQLRSYEVKVTRVSYQKTKIVVTAIDSARAEAEALATAGDLDFSGSSITDHYATEALRMCD